MKKTYINPTIQVVKIQTQQMLASSPALGGEWSSTDPILSREEYFLFEEE